MCTNALAALCNDNAHNEWTYTNVPHASAQVPGEQARARIHMMTRSDREVPDAAVVTSPCESHRTPVGGCFQSTRPHTLTTLGPGEEQRPHAQGRLHPHRARPMAQVEAGEDHSVEATAGALLPHRPWSARARAVPCHVYCHCLWAASVGWCRVCFGPGHDLLLQCRKSRLMPTLHRSWAKIPSWSM